MRAQRHTNFNARKPFEPYLFRMNAAQSWVHTCRVGLSMHVIPKWMVIVNMFKDMVFDNLEVRDCTEERFHPPPFSEERNQGSPLLVGPQTTFVTSPMRCSSSPTWRDCAWMATTSATKVLGSWRTCSRHLLSCASSRLSDVTVLVTSVCKESLSLL